MAIQNDADTTHELILVEMFIATGFPGVERSVLSLTFDAGTCPLYGNHEMEPAGIATGLSSTSGEFRRIEFQLTKNEIPGGATLWPVRYELCEWPYLS